MGEASGRFLGSGSPGRHLPLSLPAASSDSQKPAPAPGAGLTLFSTRETQEHLRHVRVCTFTETCGVPGSLPGQTRQEGGRHTRSAGEEDGRDPRRNETTPASGQRSEGTRGVRDGPR